jgi:uncharacterized protein (DUF1800 family)
MSRTHKHIVARAYHKHLRQAIHGHSWAGGSGVQDVSAICDVLASAPPAARNITRYGSPLRHYHADLKRKERRIDRCKAKQMIRRERSL